MVKYVAGVLSVGGRGLIQSTAKRPEHLSLATGVTGSRILGCSYSTNLSRGCSSLASAETRFVVEESSSVQDFLKFLGTNTERLAPLRKGEVWQAPDSDLHRLVERHFPDIKEALFVPPSEDLAYSRPKKVRVVPKELVSSTDGMRTVQASNISVGGFPSLFGAYIQSLIYANGLYSEGAPPPVYVLPPDLIHSASYGNSGQYHVSHAAPMSAPLAGYFGRFDAPQIAWATLRRNLWGENPGNSDYMIAEIDPKALLEFTTWRVGTNYWRHELGYKLRKFTGLPTIVDETVPCAKESGNVMDNIGEILGQKILHREGTLRIAHNESETQEMTALSNFLRKYNVACWQISPEETLKVLGSSPILGEGSSIWEIPEDGRLAPDIINILKKGIEHNGGHIIEGTMENIVYDNKQQRISGIKVVDGAGESISLASKNLYTSLGADSDIENGGVRDYRPVESILKGAGYSSFLLIQGKTPITRPVDENNTHCTPIRSVKTEDGTVWTLVKSTSGGTIGPEEFTKDHARNSLYIAQLLFPEHKVHIVAANSCSRPLSGKNSVVVETPLPGWRAAMGWGGTGMTYAARIATDVAPALSEGCAPPEEVKSFVDKLRANPRFMDSKSM